MSYLAKMTKVKDGYEDAEGVFYGTAVDVLGALFGFCGCGRPEDALKYIRDALRLLKLMDDKRDSLKPWNNDEWVAFYDSTYKPALRAVFGDNSGAEYLMWYLLSEKDLTEHGGSVPGWLTQRGEDVLDDLETLDLDSEAADEDGP